MKTRMFAFAVLLIASGLAAPAAAQQAQDDTATTTVAPKADPAAAARADDERMICERVKVIGSHKVERVCKTAAQRREEREGAKYQSGKAATDRMMQSRNACADVSCR